ncbi:hypothetical protein PV08_11287 [Exophiala spinifera]|uniref:Flavin reductase like domain-containing protein n=1 Tax=Exophiala spinifera TaxID=91928 RepID=A0A0D2AUZ9_9EURO|nr:uncharacterized protein PV08_11287 [Exophiala spinifera]KIW10325.1 hypothetical protein PV08_11287 [Exophiala spinifera]
MLSIVSLTKLPRYVWGIRNVSRGALKKRTSSYKVRQLSFAISRNTRVSTSSWLQDTGRDSGALRQVRTPCFSDTREITTQAQGESVPSEGTTSDNQNEEDVKGCTPSSERDGTAPPSDSLSHQVRELMRLVGHPVTVITATDTSLSPKGHPKSWRGATVSSFNTVTLEPEPIVSFNIKKNSSTFQAIEHSGHFAAHFMSGLQPLSVKMATRFSRGNHTSPFHDADGRVDELFIKRNARTLTGRPPVLHHDSNIVPLHLSCEYMPSKLVHIADHVVVFGRVTWVYHATDVAELVRSKGRTSILSYANGGYSHSGQYKKVHRVQLGGDSKK